MTAHILNGQEIALDLRHKLKDDVRHFIQNHQRPPCLAVIQVGHDPASDIYVTHKIKACEQVGIRSLHFPQSAVVSHDDLVHLIQSLNKNDGIDGILLQLPLPPHLKSTEIIALLDPKKDVDGLHAINQGQLFTGSPKLVSCTPLGCLHLIRQCCPDITGKHAVIVGRSVLVGRPMAALLLNADATVTVTHLHTQNLGDITKQADILVVAVGNPKTITANMVKPGAIVIDVGINRLPIPDISSLEKNHKIITNMGKKIVGDVDFEGVSKIAGFITPVPGGVGPLTITFLLANTIQAAVLHKI